MLNCCLVWFPPWSVVTFHMERCLIHGTFVGVFVLYVFLTNSSMFGFCFNSLFFGSLVL